MSVSLQKIYFVQTEWIGHLYKHRDETHSCQMQKLIPKCIRCYQVTTELSDTKINSKRHPVLSSLLISENRLRQLKSEMLKDSALQTVKTT